MKITHKDVIFINSYIITFLLIFNVTLLVLIIINLVENNITKCDVPSFTSSLYRTWIMGTNPSNTVTIKKNKINRTYNLAVKDSTLIDINIILPLASDCKNGDHITFEFKDIDENLGKTYYFFENYASSIFNQNTYFINILYKKVKLILVNNAWTQTGCGVIESSP